MLRLYSLTIGKFWIIILVWLNWFNCSLRVTAEPSLGTFSQRDSVDFSEDGRPKRTAGGASRGECQSQQPAETLTALIPDRPVALTISSSPTFWFYVPYNLISKHYAELILKDQHGNFIYQNEFSGQDISPGIISLSLPSKVKLPINQDFDWYFLIYCDRHNPEQFVYVQGVVRRIERLVGQNQFKDINKEQKLALYSQEQIWYDQLTIIAESLQTDPHNPKFREDWFNLLHSIGLEYLVEKSRLE